MMPAPNASRCFWRMDAETAMPYQQGLPLDT